MDYRTIVDLQIMMDKWIDFDSEFPSNHSGKYKRHGKWVSQYFHQIEVFKDLYLRHIFLMIDVILQMLPKAIKYWYDMSREQRKAMWP